MEYDGFEAYVKLKTRFARQTTAKAVLKMLEGGFEVKRTPELGGVGGKVGGREGPDEARRWRETISEAMKRTILISMCPNDVEDRAIQRVHGVEGVHGDEGETLAGRQESRGCDECWRSGPNG